MTVASVVSSGRALADKPDLCLGSLCVSPSTRMVSGPRGQRVVEPRVMLLLLTLADTNGKVIARDRLFDYCWGDVNVGEDSLNRAVAELRRTLRNVGGEDVSVETVPRVGYRLQVGSSNETGSNTTAEGGEPHRISRRLVLAGVGGVAVLSGAALWQIRSDPNAARVRRLIEQGNLAVRSGLPDAEAQGVGFFEEAARLQPDNAAAWGKLALARTAMAEFAAPDEITRAQALAQQAATRAIELQPDQADGRAALAILPPYYGDWANAERRMRAVLADHPDHLPTIDTLAFMLVGTGRAREGSRDRARMAALDPLNVNYQFRLIYALWILGDIGAMDRAAERALQLWPKHPGVWFGRLYTLAFTGRPERALQHIDDDQGRPNLPSFLLRSTRAAIVALLTGKASDRAAAADALIQPVLQGPSLSVNALTLLAGMGEIDRTFELAQAYLLEQGPLMASVRWRRGQVSINDARRRKTHPLFIPSSAGLRHDPRFMRLVEQIGLAAYWREVGVKPDFLT